MNKHKTTEAKDVIFFKETVSYEKKRVETLHKKWNAFVSEMVKRYRMGESEKITLKIHSLIQSPSNKEFIEQYVLRDERVSEKKGLIQLIKDVISYDAKYKEFVLDPQKNIYKLIAENLKKDKKIAELQQQVDQFKSLNSPEEVLKTLKENKIKLWSDRTSDDPKDPIAFYEKNYSSFKPKMYQFILGKYDNSLLKAMVQRSQYLKRKNDHKYILLSKIISPKKQKTFNDLSIIKHNDPLLKITKTIRTLANNKKLEP